MDFSGFGMAFVACYLVFLVPPIPATIAFIVIYGICHTRGMSLRSPKGIGLYAALYAISFVASCLCIYFLYLRHMYVM